MSVSTRLASAFALLAVGCQYVTGLEDLEIVASSQGAGPQGGAPSGAGSTGGAPGGAGGEGGAVVVAGGFGGAVGTGGEGGAPNVTTAIHDGSAEPLSLAQNELTLFFSDSAGTIWEWPKTGLIGPQSLIENEISPQNLWATDTELYWSAGTSPSEEIVHGTIANLAATRAFLTSGSSVKDIQVDPLGAVFYADTSGVHNATTAVTVHSGATFRIDVRDAARIFMLNPELNEVPKGGGAVTPLLSGLFGYVGIVSDATSVFAIEGTGTIARVDKDDGDQFPSLANPMDVGRDIAVDDDTDDVYFTGNVIVGRTSKTGGAITTVAAGASPNRLLVDDDNIYWLDSGTDDVMRTTR